MKAYRIIIAAMMTLAMAIALAGCGGQAETQNEAPKQEPSKASVTAEAAKPQAAEPAPAASTLPGLKTDYTSNFTGSWKACGLSVDGQYVSVKEMEDYGINDLSNIYLILYPDGSAEYYYNKGVDSGKWYAGEDQIRFIGTTFTMEDEYLYRVIDGDKLYFERISETAEKPALTKAAEGTGPEPAKEKGDAISPELKAFLDSYEAFMDEYCDFMEHYNASDLTQLVKYAELLQKYTDFAAKADEWNSKDLNDAETIYYLEVMNRVSIKLLKVSQ